MSYVDNARSISRPACWGNERSYDPNDVECSDCRFRHSCSVEVNNAGGRARARANYPGPVHPSPAYGKTSYRSKSPIISDDVEAGTGQPCVIEPEEKPIERFTKDAIGGGLRGMFYEMWQFWRHYRIR